MGGGSKPAPAPVVQQRENPYDDSWIHDKFATGQQRYNELEAFMGERRAALAQPKYYDVGGGMSVKQDNFGQYFQGQLQDQQRAFDQQLADMQRQSQAARGPPWEFRQARCPDAFSRRNAISPVTKKSISIVPNEHVTERKMNLKKSNHKCKEERSSAGLLQVLTIDEATFVFGLCFHGNLPLLVFRRPRVAKFLASPQGLHFRREHAHVLWLLA